MPQTILLRLCFVVIGICCFIPAWGFCNDLNDGIEADKPIANEDSISQKQLNKSFIIRKAMSTATKEAKDKEKESDKYSTYEIKGPLGNTHKIKLRTDKDQKATSSSPGDGMNVNSVVVKPGAKAQDITVINKVDKPIIQIDK